MSNNLPAVLLQAKAAAARLGAPQCVYRNDAGAWVFTAAFWAYENPLRAHYSVRPNGTVQSINGNPEEARNA